MAKCNCSPLTAPFQGDSWAFRQGAHPPLWLVVAGLLGFLFLVPLGQVYGDTASASATITSSNESILALYRAAPKTDDRVLREIFAIMDQVTDYETMADRALANVCANRGDELCRKIRQEFSEALKLSATVKLGRYRADRFTYGTEEKMAQGTMVQTIAYYKEESIQLDYILENKDGTWRIVNYLVDNVDTIRNYQRQFKRIVEKESLAGLLARLQKKNDEYKRERQ